LIREHFDMGDAAVIIDRDIHVLVAGALDRLSAIPMNAVAGPKNARQGLDIEMHQLARARPLVAMDGRRGLHRRQTVEAGAAKNAGHGRPRLLEPDRNRPAG